MFKSILKDADEIVDFIVEYASEPIDKELVREYFFGCQAILKFVSVNALKLSDKNHHMRNLKKEKKYELLPLETMPPLIIENNIVIDGNHRIRFIKRMNLKKISIYDIIPE